VNTGSSSYDVVNTVNSVSSGTKGWMCTTFGKVPVSSRCQCPTTSTVLDNKDRTSLTRLCVGWVTKGSVITKRDGVVVG